jgi:tRNA pseudouridine55 synthase
VTETATAIAPAVWPVDKPAGPTSHDVVARVRRGLGGRGVKVGHTGTLDPFATGLLVILVGRATRLAPWLSGADKTYLATVRTGFTSVTGDPEGPIAPAGPPPSAADLEALLPAMTGPQLQRVPAHSAVRVGGERLYRRARRGEDVEPPERRVTVHALRLVEDHGDGSFTLEARVSAGTYLRRLASDLGERLGCGAYCAALRRTRAGDIGLEGAVAPEEVGPEGGLPPAAALAHLPARALTSDELRDVANGRPVEGAADGDVALVHEGRLVAVARGDGALLRPAVVLEDPR